MAEGFVSESGPILEVLAFRGCVLYVFLWVRVIQMRKSLYFATCWLCP